MRNQDQHAPVTKILTGIQGFDEITDGGLPRGRTTLVMGGPGCGKTVFALQTLVNGARRSKESGMFVAFEESTRQIVANAATFGWDLPALEKKRLFFLDAHLSPEIVQSGEFDLIGMLSVLKAKARQINARIIVFDGIDVLLSLLADPAAERREIYRIRDWLAETGLTGVITQKVDGVETGDRYSFLQFMVDCVVVLRHQVVDGSAFRNLRVKKYRGSGFAGDEFPISLTGTGWSSRLGVRWSSSTMSRTNGSPRGFPASTTCCTVATTVAATCSCPAHPAPRSPHWRDSSRTPPVRAASARCT
jgi:circadian clock protein KaiC